MTSYLNSQYINFIVNFIFIELRITWKLQKLTPKCNIRICSVRVRTSLARLSWNFVQLLLTFVWSCLTYHHIPPTYNRYLLDNYLFTHPSSDWVETVYNRWHARKIFLQLIVASLDIITNIRAGHKKTFSHHFTVSSKTLAKYNSFGSCVIRHCGYIIGW